MTNQTKPRSVVSWKELQGNKYSKAIDPRMLSKDGLPVVMKGRVIGASKYDADFVTVVFDKEYVERWMIAKVIKPLFNCGIDYVNDLLEKTWEKSGFPTESLIGHRFNNNPVNNDQQVQS